MKKKCVQKKSIHIKLFSWGVLEKKRDVEIMPDNEDCPKKNWLEF